MTAATGLALVGCGLGVVVVRRRSVAVALVAVQSLILAALALADGIGHSGALVAAGAALVVKGLALPALLARVVVRTPEPRMIVEERRTAIFHALGFLVAENGVYAAALGTAGGMPALIEVGLVFDLVVVISVAALFSSRIHDELGVADTGLLREIRD